MIDYDALPADVPPKFVYFLNKAELYLKIGPERYRQADALAMPDESFTPDEMDAIRRGMEQICQFRGCSPDKPLEDLGRDGFKALMRTLHHRPGKAVDTIRPLNRVGLLDENYMVHVMGGKGIELYHLLLSVHERRKKNRLQQKDENEGNLQP